MLEQVCWQDFLPLEALTLEQTVPEGQKPMGGSPARAVNEELEPMRRTQVHVGRTPLEQGKSVRSHPSVEGATERCNELATAPIPCPPAPWEVNPEKKEGRGLVKAKAF